MKKVDLSLIALWAVGLSASPGCSAPDRAAPIDEILGPSEVIDLGALVTDDLPERMFGNRWLSEYGFTQPNSFEEITWRAGTVTGSDAYYTLFNHGGPHVDAPNHIGLEGGIESYPIEAFLGPLRVFDVRQFANGRTVSVDVFEDQGLTSSDIVLIYTGYVPPENDTDLPESITLTRTAAEYLANIPIRAFATDSYSVGSRDNRPVDADTEIARTVPVHEALLRRGIPIYEQLLNVERLLDRENLYFVGVPLNIRDGDGMMVRPVALVY